MIKWDLVLDSVRAARAKLWTVALEHRPNYGGIQDVDEEILKIEAVENDTLDREFVDNLIEEKSEFDEELPNKDKGIDKTESEI